MKKEKTNCPNCGMPITAEKCEYCGTLFYDFGEIEIGKPAFFKIRYQEKIFILRGVASASVSVYPSAIFYEDNFAIHQTNEIQVTIDIYGQEYLFADEVKE